MYTQSMLYWFACTWLVMNGSKPGTINVEEERHPLRTIGNISFVKAVSYFYPFQNWHPCQLVSCILSFMKYTLNMWFFLISPNIHQCLIIFLINAHNIEIYCRHFAILNKYINTFSLFRILRFLKTIQTPSHKLLLAE